MHSQVVVLGGGPGGYAAAFRAADLGLEVTLIEADPRLGGTCLLRGCIPSKALLHVAKLIGEVDEMSQWGIEYGAPHIDIAKTRAHKEGVIEKLSRGLEALAKRRKVRRVHARGLFVDSQTLELEGGNPDTYQSSRLTFDHAIIATGSVPAMPRMFDIGSPQVMDSTGALALEDRPESLLVIGGGYIGLEMGTVYAQLGSKVSVVELTGDLLPGADRDLVKPLAKRLRQLFTNVHMNTKVVSLREVGEKIEVTMEGADSSQGQSAESHSYDRQSYDRVLVSVGRRPVTSGFGLENTQVTLDAQGFIQVNQQQRTEDEHILAIGDAVGEPMLAHKASHEGRVAAEVLAGEAAAYAPMAIPAVVFTDPEIAWVGLTAQEAKQRGQDVAIGLYPWQASGRATAIGRTEGLTKWLIDPQTDRLLGCGIVGSGAGELIAEAVLAIEMGCVVHDLTDSIHPHPTLSETVAFAGEVFLGTATEIYKPKRRKKA
ncbi:MAG: dihydrolipoyl dehydrogenase [Pirellulales bacterium]